MFDDVHGMIEQCAEEFRDSVRDSFGASIITETIDPIRNEIGLLRSFHEESQRSSLGIEQLLQTARSMVFNEGSER